MASIHRVGPVHLMPRRFSSVLPDLFAEASAPGDAAPPRACTAYDLLLPMLRDKAATRGWSPRGRAVRVSTLERPVVRGSALSPTAAPSSARGARGALTHLDGVDGLRALAIVAVVAYHLDPTWLPGGFLGVDVFFVVSGRWSDAAYRNSSVLLIEIPHPVAW